MKLRKIPRDENEANRDDWRSLPSPILANISQSNWSGPGTNPAALLQLFTLPSPFSPTRGLAVIGDAAIGLHLFRPSTSTPASLQLRHACACLQDRAMENPQDHSRVMDSIRTTNRNIRHLCVVSYPQI